MYKRLIALAAALGLSASVASAATEFKADSSFEQNGLKVEMDIAPLNGPCSRAISWVRSRGKP